MNTTITFNCNDKKELLRAFVTSTMLNNQEETIYPFNQRGSMFVTRTNSRRVPESNTIAAASGYAMVPGGNVKVFIEVADNKAATLKFHTKNAMTANDEAKVDAFIGELKGMGFQLPA